MILLLETVFWMSATGFGWTYLGYPLFMYCWARLFTKPVQRSDAVLPSLTLVIPVYNEGDVIRGKIENTLKLTYPRDRLEVLVIDDGSEDETATIVREYADRGITLLQQPGRGGKMAALNSGLRVTSGDIVVLSDASPHYAPDALEKLVRSFADSQVGVVVGALALWDARNAVAKPAGLYWKYEAALRRWESATGSTVAVHGNMFGIRKSLYRPLQEAIINDEFSLAMEVSRQGYRIVFEPEAVSYDSASSSMGDEFKRRARINAGRYQALFSSGYLYGPTFDIGFRVFSHKFLRSLTPFFMIGLFITNVLIVIWSFGAPPTRGDQFAVTVARILLAGQLSVYVLALLGYVAERWRRSVQILSVPYFFVSTNLAAVIGLYRWLWNNQSVTWQKRTTTT